MFRTWLYGAGFAIVRDSCGSYLFTTHDNYSHPCCGAGFQHFLNLQYGHRPPSTESLFKGIVYDEIPIDCATVGTIQPHINYPQIYINGSITIY